MSTIQDPVILYSGLIGSVSALYSSGMYFAASHLTLPPLYTVGSRAAATFFDGFYHRGAATQVPLQALATAATLVVALRDEDPARRRKYTVAAALSAGTMIWTVALMRATNSRLLELAARPADLAEGSAAAKEVMGLLRGWYGLNLARAGMALVAGGLGLAGLLS